MMRAPSRPEIDEHTLKLMVGVVALSLPILTRILAGERLESISASYYAGGLSQAIFIGFLFAAASFFLAYNGKSGGELLASKVSALAGLCVALFPCACGGRAVSVPHVHYAAAAILFICLAFLCYCFWRRAWAKGHPQAKARGVIYVTCGLIMSVALLTLVIDTVAGGGLHHRVTRLTYYVEFTSLVAFGFSWLTASRTLPVLTRADERIALFS